MADVMLLNFCCIPDSAAETGPIAEALGTTELAAEEFRVAALTALLDVLTLDSAVPRIVEFRRATVELVKD